MTLDGQKIRTLRQRLGWSLAEMARQLGCSTDLVHEWEEGVSQPDAEVIHQLQHLSSYVDAYSEQIAQKPVAEKEMDVRRISQLTHRDLLQDN